MSSRRITIVRRLVQGLCFFLIVYGGFLLGPAIDRVRGEVVTESGYRGSYERGQGIRWVEREKVAVSFHLPATSCYYQHNGLFSGCSLLFLSEHLTWLTPLTHVLPQLFLIVALMFLAGRLWCGWVCPFGVLSDLLSWLRKLCGLDHKLLSRRWRDGLVVTKYLLLFLSLGISLLATLPALAASKGSLLLPFCQMCLGKFASPLLSFATVCWTNWRDPITSTLSVLGLGALALFLIGFGVRRLYCRICPIGGLTALFNRIGVVALQKDSARCTRCGSCARVCPVDNLTVYEGRVRQQVTACECTLCLRCVESCPEPRCLSFTFAGKRVVGS
jgi:ferredoxin-type protein NapH